MEIEINFTGFQKFIFHTAKFFGLAPFAMRNNKLTEANYGGKFYAVFLMILTQLWCFSVQNDKLEVGLHFHPLTKTIFAIFYIITVGTLTSSLIIFAFKSKKIIEIFNQIIAINGSLENLKLENCSVEETKKLSHGKMIVVTNIVILVSRVILNVNFASGKRRLDEIIYWLGNLMVAFHIHNMILIFTETMRSIGRCFDSLNRRVENILRPNFDPESVNSDLRILSAGFVRANCTAATAGVQRSRNIVTDNQSIRLQTDRIRKIVFAIGQHLPRLLSSSYMLYTKFYHAQNDDAFSHIEILVDITHQLLPRMVIVFLELYLVADACSSISEVGNSTKFVLHRAWNKLGPMELGHEFLMLSNQLLHSSISVSAFGVIDLGYSILYKILCATLAYMIMMMQLY